MPRGRRCRFPNGAWQSTSTISTRRPSVRYCIPSSRMSDVAARGRFTARSAARTRSLSTITGTSRRERASMNGSSPAKRESSRSFSPSCTMRDLFFSSPSHFRCSLAKQWRLLRLVSAAQDRHAASAVLQRPREALDHRRLPRAPHRRIADRDHQHTRVTLFEERIPVEPQPRLHSSAKEPREPVQE